MSARKIANYEDVIFDWDGCLARTLECWLAAFRTKYGERGLAPTDQEITSRFGHWEKASELGVDVREVQNFNTDVRELAESALQTVDLYPGAKEVLLRLKQAQGEGLLNGVALLTGSFLEAITGPLAYHGLSEIFDVIVTRSDGLADKPDPEGIVHAVARLHKGAVRRRRGAVMVGDTEKDILAAEAAGIDCVFFNPPGNSIVYGSAQIAYFQSLGATFEIQGFNDLDVILFSS